MMFQNVSISELPYQVLGVSACRLIAAVLLFISSFHLFFHIYSKKTITCEEEGRDG